MFMLLRVFSFLMVLVLCTSCEYRSFFKKQTSEITSSTIVDFSSVDVSPSFEICDALIEKDKQTNCFRSTMYSEIGHRLTQQKLIVTQAVDEVVVVKLQISQQGKITFVSMQASKNIVKEIPTFAKMLQQTIEELPTVYPAIKRGIPVTTQYQLPIRIQLQE